MNGSRIHRIRLCVICSHRLSICRSSSESAVTRWQFVPARAWLGSRKSLSLPFLKGAILQFQCDLRRPPGPGFDHVLHHAHRAGDFVNHDFAEITLARAGFLDLLMSSSVGKPRRVQSPNAAAAWGADWGTPVAEVRPSSVAVLRRMETQNQKGLVRPANSKACGIAAKRRQRHEICGLCAFLRQNYFARLRDGSPVVSPHRIGRRDRRLPGFRNYQFTVGTG